MLLSIGYTTYFLLISQEGILVSDFCGSVLPCLYILHSPHMLPSSLLLSIFSLAGVCLWGAYSPPHNIPVSFPIQDIPVFFLAIPFVVWPHVLPLLLFNLNIWAFTFEMTNLLISETFHFLHYLLPPHFYLFSHSILYCPTHYHFKFILKNQPPLLFSFFIPAVIGQVPKPFTPPTYSFFSTFYFCP